MKNYNQSFEDNDFKAIRYKEEVVDVLDNTKSEKLDINNVIVFCLYAFFIPFLGFYLYRIIKETRPKEAKICLIIEIIFTIILLITLFLLLFKLVLN